MKKWFLVFIMLLAIMPNGVKAVSYHSYGVSSGEKALVEAEKKEENRNFFDDLAYRFLEKDTHDTVDYIYLFIIIILMVVVIAFLNKKTYIYPTSNTVFVSENSSDATIDENDEITEDEEKKETKK